MTKARICAADCGEVRSGVALRIIPNPRIATRQSQPNCKVRWDKLLQLVSDRPVNKFVILHLNENIVLENFASGSLHLLLSFLTLLNQSLLGLRQSKPKNCPRTGIANHPNFSTVSGNNLAAKIQPQTQTDRVSVSIAPNIKVKQMLALFR